MVRKVLIIQTAFLGDLLLSIPLIKKVKSLFPGSEIHLVCRKGFSDFFVTQKLVNQAFEIKKGDKESYGEILSQLSEYDLCLCPHQSFRTALFVRKIRAKVKVGFYRWWNISFFSQRIKRDLKLPDALRQMSLLENWDRTLKEKVRGYENVIQDLPPLVDEFSMKINVTPVNLRSELATRLLSTHFVLLAPGSQWPTKRWSEQGFVEVARDLRTQGLDVALVGSGSDDLRINKIIAETVPGVVDLTGLTDLNELAYLMTKARALICNDSGLMHLASVAGLPTVAIFGPTTKLLGYRPWQNNASVVEKTIFCRPCGKHGHVKCPLGTHECMKGISSKTVLTHFHSNL